MLSSIVEKDSASNSTNSEDFRTADPRHVRTVQVGPWQGVKAAELERADDAENVSQNSNSTGLRNADEPGITEQVFLNRFQSAAILR
jgi:hypothetical protein